MVCLIKCFGSYCFFVKVLMKIKESIYLKIFGIVLVLVYFVVIVS